MTTTTVVEVDIRRGIEGERCTDITAENIAEKRREREREREKAHQRWRTSKGERGVREPRRRPRSLYSALSPPALYSAWRLVCKRKISFQKFL